MISASTDSVSSLIVRDTRREFLPGIIGLAIASMLPAFFWSGLIAWIAQALGQPLGLFGVAAIFAGVSSFLAIVCSPFLLQRQR